MKLHKETWHCI